MPKKAPAKKTTKKASPKKKTPAPKATISPSTKKKASPKKKAPTKKATLVKDEPDPLDVFPPEVERKRRAPKRGFVLELSPPEVKVSDDPIEIKAAALGMNLPINISTPVPRVNPNFMEEMKTVEALANGVKWSKYIPKVPTPKQLAGMMMVNVKELLYGGALGGGKSEFLAMEALRFCDLPGFSSIIFRRQLTDLSMPGALMERIGQWLGPHKQAGACRYDGEQHTWSFKTVWPGTDIPGPEAKLQFGYIGGAEIRHRYQSAEYQLVAFDELGQWPDNVDYLFMHTRIRKNVCPIHGKDSTGNPNYVSNCHHCTVLSQIPLRMRSASNPGMVWVKKRFGIKPDPSLYTTPRQALLAIAEGKKVKWVGTDPEARFLASYLWDNPHLDWNSYNKMLKELPEHQRSQLQDGNWEARVNSRFKRQWQQFVQLNLPEPYLVETHDDISYFEGRNFREGSYDKVTLDSQGNIHLHESIPLTSLQRVFLTADVAVTVSQGPVDSEAGKKHSSSALSTWGVTKHQELLWLHSRKLDVEIPDLVSNAMDLNQIWQPSMNKIEVTGVGIGLAQYLERAGLPVMKNWKKKDKLENSICAQLIMKAGRVLFPINARWLEDAEDDIFQWTGLPSEPDDRIDTFSDAANELGLEVAKEISGNKTTVSCRPRAIGTIGNISNGRFSGFPGLNPPKYF